MILLALLATISTADAASVYINGVRADGLTNFDLDEVDVKIDGQGNVWIDAPRYSIEVISPSRTSQKPPAVPTPAPAAAPTPVPAATPAVASGAPASAVVINTPTSTPAVPMGRYWLVSEDNSSTGHAVEVYVNEQLVTMIRSGDPQVLMDVGKWLRPGDNVIKMRALAGSPGGGVLHVYVGSGSTESGTLNLDNPDIDFARRASDDPSGTTIAFDFAI